MRLSSPLLEFARFGTDILFLLSMKHFFCFELGKIQRLI